MRNFSGDRKGWSAPTPHDSEIVWGQIGGLITKPNEFTDIGNAKFRTEKPSVRD